MKLDIPAAPNSGIVYANIQRNRYSPGYSLIVEKCVYCKQEHVHSGEEGHRSAHCINPKTGKKIPVGGYTIKVDWKNPRNAELRKEYKAYFRTHTAN